MKVLVACEFSGIVREEFRKLGHDAWSCDLLPTEIEGQHFQCDVLDILDQDWDLIIAHPPCTHLAVSGARWFEQKSKDGRQQEAIDFFMSFVNAKCGRIAIENPVGIMSSVYRKPDQIIQPFEYGEPFTKRTCLWLKNLPKLTPIKIVDKGEHVKFKSGKSMPKWYNDTFKLPPRERERVRSRTFPGIAEQMASQWGTL